MKKVLITSAIILSLLFTFGTSDAQVSMSVNIGLQPEWGPVGYDLADYYYMPQYEAYYYVPQRQFIYLDRGRWIFAAALPPRFGTVNLFSTYKVVINEPKAYLHFNEDKVKYTKYKGGEERQEMIRDSKDPKYAEARNHQEHGNAKASPEHNNSNVSPEHNNQKAGPQHGNAKGKDAKKENHSEGGHPH